MTNKKSTKRALLVSVMAMVICFTMLLGTTFAWFTDNEAVEENIIKAGTLDVGLTGDKITFDNFEPGYVLVEHYKVTNLGTLAFNYKLKLVAADPAAINPIASQIEVYYYLANTTPDRATLVSSNTAYLGTLDTVLGTSFTFGADFIDEHNGVDDITLVLKMKESAGNTYQGQSLNTYFSVQVLAAQRTTETDDLGNANYDNDAIYDDGLKVNP